MKTILLPIALILGFQLSNIAPIGLPSGSLMFQLSGTCPSRTTESTALNGLMFIATTIANGNAGTTGGSDTITPAGSNSAPALTMNSYTPAGTNGTSSTTPAGTVAWPAGVPTLSGSSSTVSAQTFTGQAATLTGSVAAPSFTGTQFDNRSAFVRVIVCAVN
jgi:hypothetical protein